MAHVVWGLYLAGEPIFAVVVMAICIGAIIIFGSRRFYIGRFIFPAITAVFVFIALPVVYASYVGLPILAPVTSSFLTVSLTII